MATENLPRQMLTGAGVALALSIPESLVRKAIAAGVLVPSRAGRTWVFDPAQLVDLRQQLVTAGLITPLGSPLRHLVPSLPQTA